MEKRIMTIIFIVIFCSVSSVFAQEKIINYNFDTAKTYRIELQDGSEFIGNFLLRDSVNVVIKTSLIPKIEIPIKEIKTIQEVPASNIKKGKYWFPNPNATRYLFGPSAFTLKKGEGYYQNTYLFLNSVHVGITDNISIGGGLEFLSTFGTLASGSFDPIFYITPKIAFQVSEKFHAGGGVLYISTPGFDVDDRGSLGIVYGIGTYGSLEHNITGGLGWGFVNGEFSGRPIITISGMTRIGRRTALVTENWFVPADSYYGIITYGIRFFGEKMSVDLAFINNSDIAEGLIIGIPFVDFVVKF